MGAAPAPRPACSPAAFALRCKPLVPLLTATACRTPINSAIFSSNSPTFGPSDSEGVLRTPSTAERSESEILGLDSGMLSVSGRVFRPVIAFVILAVIAVVHHRLVGDFVQHQPYDGSPHPLQGRQHGSHRIP